MYRIQRVKMQASLLLVLSQPHQLTARMIYCMVQLSAHLLLQLLSLNQREHSQYRHLINRILANIQ